MSLPLSFLAQLAPMAAASIWNSDLVYAVPLVVVVSLVYAGTRHEPMAVIVRHASRLAMMITFFMGVIFGVLAWLSWMVTG